MDAQTSGESLEDEINQNLIYSALAVQTARNDIANALPVTTWASLSEEDKWLLTFAQYNIGAGNSQSVVVQIIQNVTAQGDLPDWATIAPILSNYQNSDTPDPNDTYLGTGNYANSIINLAIQGGQ